MIRCGINVENAAKLSAQNALSDPVTVQVMEVAGSVLLRKHLNAGQTVFLGQLQMLKQMVAKGVADSDKTSEQTTPVQSKWLIIRWSPGNLIKCSDAFQKFFSTFYQRKLVKKCKKFKRNLCQL